MADAKSSKRNQPCPQERRLKIANTLKRHGQCASATTGVTPEFRAWAKLRARCNNVNDKKYHCYGARGIKVCERWQKFENFFEDMGPKPSPKHSVNRIDNDGDYCPENCEWADAITQANNKQNTVKVIYEGREIPIRDLARLHGVDPKLAWRRYHQGYSAEDAVNYKYGVFFTLNGETKGIAEWAKELNVSLATLYMRRCKGWSDEKILTHPFRRRKSM